MWSIARKFGVGFNAGLAPNTNLYVLRLRYEHDGTR